MPRSRKNKTTSDHNASSSTKDQRTPEPTLPTPAATPRKATRMAPMSCLERAIRKLGILDEEEEIHYRSIDDIAGMLEAEKEREGEVKSALQDLLKKRETRDLEDEEEEQVEGPWEAKGDEPGYLDSEDEAETEEEYRNYVDKEMDRLGRDEWRIVAEFGLNHMYKWWRGMTIGK